MELDFRNSIKYYKSIYYHFLDGYIDPNIGSDLTIFVSLEINNLTKNNKNIIILMDIAKLRLPIYLNNN